ncbi:hypothetical protein [Williamsia sterculiae]|uniref:hypothetical protein n=1 Tax=Williamsia sterculiae TaxID=1344003 RepID=UPI0009F81EE2|nr:hypothetical protein [Williamsia sterculiae]
MRHWFTDEIVAHGKLPLLLFFAGFVLGFIAIRVSVRMIRAQVRWWPGNIRSGDTHVHHVVFGVVITLASGLGLVATSMESSQSTASALACLFGIGAALILDEFALIFYLRDVYWAEEGRASVDAVFVAIGVTGMVLLGFRPLELFNLTAFADHESDLLRSLDIARAMLSLLLAAVVLLKGKIWTGLLGIFIWPLLLIGSLRLARPGSPWARWRYTRRPRRMSRALRRERRLRRPLIRAKIFTQDLMAGSPDVPHAKQAAEEVLDVVVHPAPAPISPVRGPSGTMVGLPNGGTTHRERSSGGDHFDSEHEPVEPSP